jgi:hypothetical protein
MILRFPDVLWSFVDKAKLDQHPRYPSVLYFGLESRLETVGVADLDADNGKSAKFIGVGITIELLPTFAWHRIHSIAAVRA